MPNEHYQTGSIQVIPAFNRSASNQGRARLMKLNLLFKKKKRCYRGVITFSNSQVK